MLNSRRAQLLRQRKPDSNFWEILQSKECMPLVTKLVMDSVMKTDDSENAEIETSFFRERFHFIVLYQFNIAYVNIAMRWYSFLLESLSQVFSYEEMRLSWVSVYPYKHPTDET